MGREKLNLLLRHGNVGYYLYQAIIKTYEAYRFRGSVEDCVIREYKKIFGVDPDLKNPKTMNEKLQWLKLYDHKDYYTLCADKYTSREYLQQKFGDEVKEHFVPLCFVTNSWKDVTLDIIPDEPCIIKATHSSGDYVIIKDKTKVDINYLRELCRAWLAKDYYKLTQEWQYKHSTRRIIIEKLLQTKEHKIPNDYKLHYLNGKLEFVYCSVDREGGNKRNIYDADWNPLYFTWVEPWKDAANLRGAEIEAPATFEQMKEYGAVIAKDFDYVRVDYYDVDGKLYFGEITLHHGSGLDVFRPEEYDLIYGEKLKLTGLK